MLESKTKKRLGIIILNYNSYNDSEKCVSEFLTQLQAQDRILLIDNNSTDKSGQRLAERFQNEKNLVYLQNTENLGYAKGNNLGIEYFRKEGFELTLVCNPDIILLPNALNILRDTLSREGANVVGPKILNPDKTVAIDCAKNHLGIKEKFLITTPLRFFDWFGVRKRFYYNFDYTRMKEVYMLSGSFMLFTTEILTRVKGFDNYTFLYEEEPILFHKIHNSGDSKVLFVPEASVIHNHPKGLKSKSTRVHFIDSEQYYLKHYLHANVLIRLFFFIIRSIRRYLQSI